MANKHNAKLLDGRKRQAIITALADGQSKRSIARRLNVSNNTVDAVAAAEWQQVAARRERLIAKCERIADKATDQLLDHLDKGTLPPNMLNVVAGTAIDKAVLLRPQDAIRVSVTSSLNIDAQEIWRRLRARALELQPPEANQGVESTPTQ